MKRGTKLDRLIHSSLLTVFYAYRNFAEDHYLRAFWTLFLLASGCETF